MVKGLIINHKTSYIRSLHKLFIDCDIVNYTHFTPEYAEKYDYIVLSGGEINISNIHDLIEEKQFLKSTTKPIFGVCLGMQILSIIYGQPLLELPSRIKKYEDITLMDSNGDMCYNHGWYIPEIPVGFEGIKSEFVKAIWNKNIFAVQGHPELSGQFGIHLRNIFMEKYFPISK